MFTQLQTLAQRATLSIILAAEGDKLRLTVQPKPNGSNAPVPPALSMVGTAAEFDQDFAGAVERYQVPVASLLDQADVAAKAVADTKVGKKAAAVKKAAPTKKKAAPTKAPAKAAPTKASKAPAKAPEKKVAAPKPAKAAKPAETPPDRDALIAMAQEYLAKLNPKKKPSRVDFIKKFKHGRRYERLFTNFNELLDAARQQPLALDNPGGEPAADDASKVDPAAVTGVEEAKAIANAALVARPLAAEPASAEPAAAEQSAAADEADEPALNLI